VLVGIALPLALFNPSHPAFKPGRNVLDCYSLLDNLIDQKCLAIVSFNTQTNKWGELTP